MLRPEVLEELVGFGIAAGAEEEPPVIDHRVDVAGIDLEAELVGLFGGGGVALLREEIPVTDGHVGIIFERFIAVRGGAHLRSGVAPIIDRFRSGSRGEWLGIVARAEFEDRAGRCRIRIDTVEAKRFLQSEAEFGIAFQDELEEAFV